MKFTKIFFLLFCAFSLSLLDTSFFSAMPLFGATIISSFVLALTLAISQQIDIVLTYVIAVILFFSVFSSLPIWFVVIGFLGLPYLIFYVKKKYFPEPSVFSSILFFATGTLIFSLILLVCNKEWNLNGLVSLIYFVILNSLFGTALFSLTRRLKKDFSRKEIKF